MTFKLSRNIFLAIKSLIYILYGLFAINAFVNFNSFDLKIAILLCGILIELTVITFINHWYKLKQPLLLDWFRLATFMSIVLNFMSITEILDNNINFELNDFVSVSSTQALPTITAVLLGLLALRLGEMLVKLSKKSKITLKYSVQKHIRSLQFKRKIIFLIFTVLLILAQLFLMFKGIVGYGTEGNHTMESYSFMIQSISIMGPFVLAMFAIIKYKYKDKGKIFNITFLIYFLMQVGIGFLSGMKENIISPILIVIIPYLLSGNKISLRIFIGGFIFFILLYPINNNYRYYTNAYGNLNKMTYLQLAISDTFEGNFIENFVGGTQSYQNRLSLFPLFMYSVENEKEWTEYKNLNRYIYLPISWIIPRFLMTSKPTSNTGSKLYHMTTGRETSSVTPSTYGWSYLEGGYIPLFLSFLLFGAFITYLQVNLNKEHLFGLLLFITVLVALLKVESDIYFKISEILQTILIGFILYKMFFKVKEKKVSF
ncbi:MAG: hypothetical protein R3294_03385 [Arenibacter troitsensis]|nr:hypothetical protein [Arenibacter troitsensis]